MENAAEALKMAGTVLIFVLAISIIIFAFGQVRQTSDTILNYKDRETEYISDELNHYYQTPDNVRERTVGLETVIPSIFRAYIEEYKIVFEGLDEPLFEIKDNDGSYIPKYTLDIEINTGIGDANKRKRAFLSGILYRDFDNEVIKAQKSQPNKGYLTDEKAFEEAFGINIEGYPSLYEQLQDKIAKDKKITEYLGVYYKEDNPNKAEVNIQKKRIITYKIE